MGKTRDISLGGVCFEVSINPGIPGKIRGKAGQIRLILPAGEILSDCVVIRVSSSAVALQFTNFQGTKTEKSLRTFLESQVTYLAKLSRLG